MPLDPVKEYMKKAGSTLAQAQLAVEEMNKDAAAANAFGNIMAMYDAEIGDFPELRTAVIMHLSEHWGISLESPKSILALHKTTDWAAHQIPVIVGYCRMKLEAE